VDDELIEDAHEQTISELGEMGEMELVLAVLRVAGKELRERVSGAERRLILLSSQGGVRCLRIITGRVI